MLVEAAQIGTLVAAVATLLSLAWAIFLWRRQKVHEELQEFRKDLSDFRGALQLFSDYVGDTSAIEAGNLSAFRVLEMAGTDNTTELKEFLANCDRTEVFLGSIIFGHQESSLFQEKKNTLAGIQIAAGRNNEAFPITTRLLGTVVAFLGRTADIKTALRLFMENENVVDELLKGMDDQNGRGMTFSKLSDFFTQIGGHDSEKRTKVTLLTTELVELIVSNYLARSDRQLLQASRHEKRLRSKGVEETSTFTGDLTKLSEGYAKLLSSGDWTALVERRTKLNEL